MCMTFAYMYICVPPCLSSSEESVGVPGTEVRDGCEVPLWVLVIKP